MRAFRAPHVNLVNPTLESIFLDIFYEKCEKFEKVHLYVVFGRIGSQKKTHISGSRLYIGAYEIMMKNNLIYKNNSLSASRVRNRLSEFA